MKKFYTKNLYVAFAMIFVLGSFQTAKSQTWTSVGSSDNPVGYSSVQSTVVYQGVLYTGSYDKKSQLRSWDGKTWKVFASVSPKKSWGAGLIKAMAVYKNKLYVAGEFDSINNIHANGIACWDGTSWASVGRSFDSTVTGSYPYVNCMKVVKDRLYVGGGFLYIAKNTYTNSIAYWDGASWNSLDKVPALAPFTVYCLGEYKNELYIGGGWFGKSGVSLVKYRDTVGFTPILNSDSYVQSMSVFKNRLYFGGDFTHVNDTVVANSIAVFDGTRLTTIGSGAENKTISNHSWVTSMYSTTDRLYVGGQFEYMNGLPVRGITAYDGKVFSSIDKGLKGDNHYVTTICEYKNELYVGGEFVGIGKSNTVNIAKLDGLFLGTGLILKPKIDALRLYPNPVNTQLYIAGLDEGQVSILNSVGQLIPTNQGNSIDVSILPAGVYYLRVDRTGQILTQKFIKK